MARRIRVEYEGALYHVINRGNDRRDVFAGAGASTAFETALEEACDRHGAALQRLAPPRCTTRNSLTP